MRTATALLVLLGGGPAENGTTDAGTEPWSVVAVVEPGRELMTREPIFAEVCDWFARRMQAPDRRWPDRDPDAVDPERTIPRFPLPDWLWSGPEEWPGVPAWAEELTGYRDRHDDEPRSTPRDCRMTPHDNADQSQDTTIAWGRSALEPLRGHRRTEKDGHVEVSVINGRAVGPAVCGAWLVDDLPEDTDGFIRCELCVRGD